MPRLYLLIGLALLGCRSFERPTRSYATVQAAIAAGEVRRGWVPAWVPPEATDLHIQNDIDSNERWLRFALPDSASTALRAQLQPVPDSLLPTLAQSAPTSVDWWFDGFIQASPANDAALNATVYQGADSTVPAAAHLAFERGSPRIYLWWEPL